MTINTLSDRLQTTIEFAFNQGYYDIVDLLIREGANVPNVDASEQVVTPSNMSLLRSSSVTHAFHVALAAQHEHFACLYVEQGANVDAVYNLRRPIFMAIQAGMRDLINLMIKFHVYLICREVDYSPLTYALTRGQWAIAMDLIEELRATYLGRCVLTEQDWITLIKEFNPEIMQFLIRHAPEWLDKVYEDGVTPCMMALRMGGRVCVQMLLDCERRDAVTGSVHHSVDRSLMDDRRNTLLHYLTMGGADDSDLARILVASISVDMVNYEGYTAYDLAEKKYLYGVMRVICPDELRLWHAIKHHSIDARALIGEASPQQVNIERNGESPLTLCILHGSPLSIEALLDRGADVLTGIRPNFAEYISYPLYCALRVKSLVMTRTLVQYGAPLDAAIFAAIEIEWMDVVPMLVQLGASMHARNHEGLSPILWCARHGSVWMMERLVDEGANLADVQEGGKEETILHCAIHNLSRHAVPLVRWLLSNGMVYLVGKADSDGCTPLQYAQEQRNPTMLRTLTGDVFYEIPIPVHIKQMMVDREPACIVCFTPYEPIARARLLYCGHLICVACIKEVETCPQCRCGI